MVETYSQSLDRGIIAPDFTLPNYNPAWPESQVSLDHFKDHQGLLVAFICNHCPYVIHILSSFVEFANTIASRNIAVVAISANDIVNYPQDGPEQMATMSQEHNFHFPYLYDASQTTARAYQAVCTPDFYLFGSDMRLYYHGRYDASSPGNNNPVTGAEMDKAVNALLAGAEPPDAKASIGCSIKWKH